MIEDFIIPGTNFTLNDGIYQILEADFEKKIKPYVDYSIKAKAPNNLDPIEDYERLPFIKASKHKMDWKLRQEDVYNVKKEIGNKGNLCILESGPFNGWLTHHLQNMGHIIVCIDYFEDETYGLRSKFRYKNNNWISIQCNLEEVNFLQPCFDLVILNHGIQFYSDIKIPITQLKRLLKPGGKLIILGLFIFINDSKKKEQVKAYKKKFKEKTGLDMFMYHSVKGLLNRNDLQTLRDEQIKLRPYTCCLLRNAIARILTYKQRYYYGVYLKSNVR